MFETTWIIIRTRSTTKVGLELCSCGITDNSARKAEISVVTTGTGACGAEILLEGLTEPAKARG